MSTPIHTETVREKILASADEFFSRFGFYKTTMDEIAKKIHKAKGVLYYYFNSKEELYTEVVKAELQKTKEALNEVINNDDDPVTTLEKYIEVRFKMLNEARNYHETLRADFNEKYGFVKVVRDDFENFERVKLKKILTDGQQMGYFKLSDIDLTIDVIMTIAKSVEIPLYLEKKYNAYEKIINEMTFIIFNGLKKNSK